MTVTIRLRRRLRHQLLRSWDGVEQPIQPFENVPSRDRFPHMLKVRIEPSGKGAKLVLNSTTWSSQDYGTAMGLCAGLTVRL